MAITVEQRTSIVELVVGMFGAAPGSTFTLTTGLPSAFDRFTPTLTQPAFA